MNHYNQPTPSHISFRAMLAEPIAWVNLTLAFIACALLVYYVISANGIASAQFEISQQTERVAVMVEQTTALAAEKNRLNDPRILADYAQAPHLVQDDDREVIYDQG